MPAFSDATTLISAPAFKIHGFRSAQEIKNILGLSKKWNMILIGAGNLGSALSQYNGFRDRGFEIKGIFDNDLNKVGLMLNGLPIYPISEMADFIDSKLN